ncbi:MAG TPA: hypothetical protein VM368_00095 [Flavisolibacter sp.]|nr:hypothetical protein [Flavisolibacter sp.]
MQKVYLLLRDNQQTGPYSLDELIQLKLKDSDLIWIEGSSAGWYYPKEIDALRPFVAAPVSIKNTKENIGKKEKEIPAQSNIETVKTQAVPFNSTATTGKKVFVSLPNKPFQKTNPQKKTLDEYFDQRTEQLRSKLNPIEATTEKSSIKPVEQPVPEIKVEAPKVEEPKKTPIVPPVTKEVFTATETKKTAKKIEPFFTNPSLKIPEERVQPNTPKVARKKKNYSNELTGAAFLLITGLIIWWVVKTIGDNSEPTTTLAQQMPVSGQPQESNTLSVSSNPELIPDSMAVQNFDEATPEQSQLKIITPTTKKPFVTKKTATKPDSTPITPEVVSEPVIRQEEPVLPAEQKSEPVVIQEAEKKKGLLKKIGGLFKKKEEAPPANSTNREESAPVNIIDDVDVKISTTNNSWMMGVQGLKLTLYNKSNVTLKKASVDVIYYNDQNGVLEKKTLQFFNIPPKKSQAIAAPDHQYADHAGYKILSAVGEN